MDDDLLRRRDGTLMGARRSPVVLALSILRHWMSFVELTKELGVDAF